MYTSLSARTPLAGRQLYFSEGIAPARATSLSSESFQSLRKMPRKPDSFAEDWACREIKLPDRARNKNKTWVNCLIVLLYHCSRLALCSLQGSTGVFQSLRFRDYYMKSDPGETRFST